MINRPLMLASLLATGLLMAGASLAQAPAGSTGACKDGTYSSQPSKKGACRGHKGVQEWYAADAAPAAAPAAKATRASKAAAAAAAPAATAAASAAPAAGSTGQCKDGTYTDTPTKKGACRGHKGVKEWYAADAAPAAAAPAAAAAAPMAAPAPVVAAAPAPAPAPSSPAARRPTQFTPPAQAAAGGGAGMVWANGSSQVYHCPGDKWYGKTKSGSYMTEADAKAKGLHADHGKACTN